MNLAIGRDGREGVNLDDKKFHPKDSGRVAFLGDGNKDHLLGLG